MRAQLLVIGLIALASRQASGQELPPREAACVNATLPAGYEQYLETAFLGPDKHLQVGSINVSYFQFGPLSPSAGAAGRPLVLVAGQGATKTVWGPDLLSSLAQGRQVVVFDNRGIGESLDPSSGMFNYTIAQFADSTVDFLEELYTSARGQYTPPDLLGWSMGGEIALTLASTHPQAINRLVLADTLAGAPGDLSLPGLQADLETIAPYELAGIPIPATLIFPNTPAGNAGLCRFLAFQEAMPADPATTQQVASETPAQFQYNVVSSGIDLASITTPTLIIAGQQEQVLPFAGDVALLTDLPHASLISFPDSGHATILQHSLTCAAIISAWLDQDLVQSSGQVAPSEAAGAPQDS